MTYLRTALNVRVVALLLLPLAFGACGGASKSSANAPATTTAPTGPPTTTTTVPPDAGALLRPGVGPLCANATQDVVDDIVNQLGGKVPPAQYGDTPFHKLLDTSLNDCSSRIEWLTSIESQGASGNEAFAELIFKSGCATASFLHQAMAGVGSDAPIPVACREA